VPAPVARVGDMINAPGGVVVKGAPTVFVEGQPIGTHPSPITPHVNYKPPHTGAVTAHGVPTVFAEGQPILCVGIPATCGHIIATGSKTVFTGL
jgi:uncharacterized Zn-binding protein involved in type VI secretion